MGDNQAPRAGFTRTGKSLKQVRRYYAMQDAQKKKRRSPETEDEERNTSASKRKRSPDDDKLSKRIFQELKVQQEAIEKRSRRFPSPPDQNAAPVLEMREVGPVFLTKNEIPPTKSVKSNKSKSAPPPIAEYVSQNSNTHTFSPTTIGCIIACFNIALVYVATWIYMIATRSKDNPQAYLADFGAMRWLAITSSLVVIAVPYWLIASHELMHAIITLIMLMSSLLSVSVYLLYHSIVPENPGKPQQYYLSDAPNPLNFWFPVTFLLLHVISVFFMIKQISILSRSKPDVERGDSNRGEAQQMSVFLAPR